ncbi:acetoacetyl-CoA synthase [Kaistia algarum]|uniref:type II toxin-antitoxin system CcdA family antitoxin n=1 Tax=Kaistia algarum TaxID=2083279 RepID=UPI000CE741FD|nr:type II toxin-antitoxin system CcdA family antitoxin [Kaistia algarum]MCX5515971.1 type II toxin-antitoxin system CcdA family antitoxin [Kaistia algarum]PPE81108.1 acetoacetyl-CoA synthase [Kaistia algarum]
MANAAARSENRKLPKAKRAVNVSVRADLVDEAKALGTNISAVLERALEAEHRQQRADRWREEDREAIDEANAELARNGLWSARLRLF